MAIYSINDLEKLSGVKSHTIRAWEQRHGILRPKRTPTNIRYYEDEDLQRLLNVALLNRHGYKISKIAAMSREDLVQKTSSISEVSMGLDAKLDVLMLAVIEMDEYRFSHILDTHIAQLGFEETVLEIIYPFMEKLSLLWLTGSIKPVQENFVTFLIRNKLISAIEKLPLAPVQSAKKFLLYLPKGEQEELSLLFMQYILKSRGFNPINLGSNVTVGDVKDSSQIIEPHYVFTILSERFGTEPIMKYIAKLTAAAPNSQILVTGYLAIANSTKMPESVTPLPSLGETIEFLDKLDKSA